MTHLPALLQNVASRSGALHRRSQRGFTLIELMVSVTLGLLIMVALIVVFLNVSRTNTEMTKTNSLIENGRFAIDILQEDIGHGGFLGGYVPQFDDLSATTVPGDAPSLAPDPCLAYASWATTVGHTDSLLGIPVQGFDAVPTGTTGCAAFVTNKKASTDVLVTRRAEVCLPGVGNCEALDNNKVYFQASFCENETTATTPLRYVLSNASADFTLKKRGCTGTPPAATTGTVSDKRKFISNIYYVRTYAVTAGDGIPTLMRASFNATGGTPVFDTAVALIEGIEGFRVELGIDAQGRCGANNDYAAAVARVSPSTCALDAVTATNNTMPTNRGDGVPEMPFVHCTGGGGCTNVQLRDVVAVKLYVLARSHDTALGHTDSKVYCLSGSCSTPTKPDCLSLGAANTYPLLGPFCDGYKRHIFETTIRLNNISGRRETP